MAGIIQYGGGATVFASVDNRRSRLRTTSNLLSRPPSNGDLSRLLKLSIEYGDVNFCKAVHASILRGEEDDIRLQNSLVTAYLRLGRVNDAESVFDSIPCPDVVSHTAMISAFAKSHREDGAVRLFFEMRDAGVGPNGFTLVAMLTACSGLGDLELGTQIHAMSVKTGHLDSTHVSNTLMRLYAEWDCLDSAFKLFDEMPNRDISSWNTLISSMVKAEFYDEAFECFIDLLTWEDLRADQFTLSTLIYASGRCFDLKKGSSLHGYSHKLRCESHLSLRNSLIQFYAECGCVEDVEALFNSMPLRDAFTWTQMIKAYSGFGLLDSAIEIFDRAPDKSSIAFNTLLSGLHQNGDGFRALRFFRRMLEDGVAVTDSTLTTVLCSCGCAGDAGFSEQIHGFVLKFNVGGNDRIQAALLDMCTKCGRMEDADKIFDRMPQRRSPVTLTTMVSGYARNLELEKAASLIGQYTFFDEFASASILAVCGDLGFRDLGEQLHCRVLKDGSLRNAGVGNSLISMYSKSGGGGGTEIFDKIFESMPYRDAVSWNCLLSGYVSRRLGDDALNKFDEMQKSGGKPDSITCSLIITAYKYTNSNMAQQCHEFVLSMKSAHGIDPDSNHYASLIGVLGRWGMLERAEKVANTAPFDPGPALLKPLLESCIRHKDPTVGKRTARRILTMDPDEPSTFVLKSNLYSASGRWHCSELVRDEMRARGFRKRPARSWITDRKNGVHSFFARDKSHPETRDIYAALEVLFKEAKKAGYEPDTSFVLQEVEEFQKVDFLMHHSAKIAAAFGLLKKGTAVVRVMKNVRLCGDCHSFLRSASVVCGREIHLRDPSGFHLFRDGQCSCKDRW
ncbi:hypothetical protein M569_16559 [Genlisea aurea]|uniref:DYW domain-containing protein n=1 Tax=Genlisea aurea TaxID=192259 RepID=S8DFU9_9LAMI|nr:hypothetical protein M569_16559 [Genlisea aurea]